MPTSFELSILVNAVEMISFIPFESMSFVDYPTRVSYFNFTIENPSIAPTLHDSVIITSGETTIFIGNIVELNERKRDNGITTTYEVECADFKIKLMKSYLTRAQYTGSDASILSDLLSNTYPDLTSYFDFSTNVNSFLSDMALDTNENSLLDALRELAELAGGAAFRFDQALFDILTVDYDAGYGTYANSQDGTFTTFAEAAVGNPDDALQGIFTGAMASGVFIRTIITGLTSGPITNVALDFYLDTNGVAIVWEIEIWDSAVLQKTFQSNFTYGNDPSPLWRSENISDNAFNPEDLPVTGDEVRVKLISFGTSSSDTHDFRLDNIKITVGSAIIVDYDNGYSNYVNSQDGIFTTFAEAAVGNPNDAIQGTFVGSMVLGSYIRTTITLDAPAIITNVGLDYYFDTLQKLNEWKIQIKLDGDLVFTSQETSVPTDMATWETKDILADGSNSSLLPKTGDEIIVTIDAFAWSGGSPQTHDFRIDNIVITTDSKDSLVWDSEPDAGSFNIDIQGGNEFAFNLDLFEGSIEDYNSITVIGGSIDVAVDYTMESDGDLIYFPIATHIKDIVVYKNTGTDGTPTWTVQSDGQWGVDELTADGGSKDVLYDTIEHWLVFNSTPSNLSKSIRLTGTINKPIRVRVEDVGAGVPTYATTVYAENVQTEDEAVAFGQSILATNNAIKRMTFKTYEPGLKPGQNIDLDDSARGLNETLRITKISTRWLGASGHAEFTIECGNDESEDAGVLIANNDMRSRENRFANVAVTSTINNLFDADGTTVLTDDDGRQLYESA